jgi:hypothetical protein
MVALQQQPHIYGVINPFPWMTSISPLQGKTNFFEKCVCEYAKSGVGVDTPVLDRRITSIWMKSAMHQLQAVLTAAHLAKFRHTLEDPEVSTAISHNSIDSYITK